MIALSIVTGCSGGKPAEDAYVQSPKGDPATVGCADGQREGFADLEAFADVAGCVGKWRGTRSLQDPRTGNRCGDDLGECEVPADVCAEGWHVCGQDGFPDDVRGRLSADECKQAGPGRFNAGLSHGQTAQICPPPPAPGAGLPCRESGNGSEPVCCGMHCRDGLCLDAVWTGATRISLGREQGCGGVSAERNPGVMCCKGEGLRPSDEEIAAAEAARAAAESKPKALPPPPDTTLDRELGRRVAEARREQGLTQEALARKTKLPLEVITKLEAGEGLPRLEELERIARTLGKTTVQLIDARRSRGPTEIALDDLMGELRHRTVDEIETVRDVARAIFAHRNTTAAKGPR